MTHEQRTWAKINRNLDRLILERPISTARPANLLAKIEKLEAALAQVDDVLVVNWVTVKDGDYRQALADLVTWSIQIHDDPSINPDAPRITKAPKVSPNI